MSEKNINFDEIIDRRNTDCLKYDFAKKRGVPVDTLPMWVADMDFKVSSYIQEALNKQVEHGIYGYTDALDDYYSAVGKWIKKQYGYQVSENEIIKTPGVVYAIGAAINAFTEKGDAVLIQEPVYYPFGSVVKDNGRKLVSSSLVYDSEKTRYYVDINDFEKKIVDNKVKLFLLCNPHNPVGRAWSREELIQMGDICRKNGVIVFSDEIHADYVWNGKHCAFIEASESFSDISITATSPSKTFNIAGLQVSNIVIKNEILKNKLQKAIDATGYSQLNAAGIVACKAAYSHGEEWYEAVKSYIKENILYMYKYINENIPLLKMVYPEATYLVWVDFSRLGLDDKEIDSLIVNKAKLWLDSGYVFGKAGEGFQRFNVACPRETLKKALEQLEKAVEGINKRL